MAPDRGLCEGGISTADSSKPPPDEDDDVAGQSSSLRPATPVTGARQMRDLHSLMEPVRTEPAAIEGYSFTARGVAVGLAIGLVLACTNISMGLQSGWVSTMTMPASLMGFGFFKMISKHLKFPFSPVENVLVQTVAGSMGIMPLGCGLVGVIPAMNFLLMKDENGPINLSLWQLVIWSLGVCYFGVVFAVPLRRQVIIREKLKFPSGFSTAVLISMLHGRETDVKASGRRGSIPAGFASLASTHDPPSQVVEDLDADSDSRGPEVGIDQSSWKRNVQLMLVCFSLSGFFTLLTYFFPLLRKVPIFGWTAAGTWLWDFNPSLAYVGQGVIMGPTTTLHMLLGAVVGWGILSPLAKYRGWAPGDIGDWETGSKGWIVWISLAIMLADAIVSLGYLALRSVFARLLRAKGLLSGRDTLEDLKTLLSRRPSGYTTVSSAEDDGSHGTMPVPASPLSDFGALSSRDPADDDEPKQAGDGDDASADQQISNGTVAVGLVVSILICIVCTHIVFGNLVPLFATIVAVMMALLLSIMGVRALGETDLNPVSGISKLAQLFFAVIIPQSNKSSVLINLVAGAISEAGALQAGDLMQDLKTGHLLGAAPKAQFWGQVIGATAGAVVSALIYRLYAAVYTIPSELYQVPTAYVWVFTARLVTGKGLPYMAQEWALGSAILFAAFTALRIGLDPKSKWQALIPGGIAVAVGMYNVPSFTLARTVGGVLSWWWRSRMGWEETPLIVLASGFILGEGFLNIVNLLMESAGVPHL